MKTSLWVLMQYTRYLLSNSISNNIQQIRLQLERFTCILQLASRLACMSTSESILNISPQGLQKCIICKDPQKGRIFLWTWCLTRYGNCNPRSSRTAVSIQSESGSTLRKSEICSALLKIYFSSPRQMSLSGKTVRYNTQVPKSFKYHKDHISA